MSSQSAPNPHPDPPTPPHPTPAEQSVAESVPALIGKGLLEIACDLSLEGAILFSLISVVAGFVAGDSLWSPIAWIGGVAGAVLAVTAMARGWNGVRGLAVGLTTLIAVMTVAGFAFTS